MDFSVVNIWAVLVAALSSLVVGFIWYSPALFEKAWKRESGVTDETIKNSNILKIFGLTYILSFIIAINLAMFFGGKVDFAHGLLYGGFTGIFWIAAALGIIYLFEHKSFKLWLIHSGNLTITFIVMGGILGAWH
jgi:hypothetical protein